MGGGPRTEGVGFWSEFLRKRGEAKGTLGGKRGIDCDKCVFLVLKKELIGIGALPAEKCAHG